jgi:hypothetical protein
MQFLSLQLWLFNVFYILLVWPQDTQGANGEMAGGDQRIEVA